MLTVHMQLTEFIQIRKKSERKEHDGKGLILAKYDSRTTVTK